VLRSWLAFELAPQFVRGLAVLLVRLFNPVPHTLVIDMYECAAQLGAQIIPGRDAESSREAE
jgi:hypothetical protein